MEEKKTPHITLQTLVLCLVHLLGLEAATEKSRCDKLMEVATTQCVSCLTFVRHCPAGFQKRILAGNKLDCTYESILGKTVKHLGCSYECYKNVLQPECCAGYWGEDCMECPESAQKPCNNNGVCSDGFAGNGTCSCKSGFTGTACEDCEGNHYGPSCSSVCNCVHGICNQGIRGDGTCTCFSGYKGPSCDQELPHCASLRCSKNSRCMEDAATGILACKCKPGFKGDGTQCTAVNPCLQSACHKYATCTYMGPDQHSCTCVDGYSGDGQVCLPINPCQTNLGGCPSNTTLCVYDSPGKSHCECQDGYSDLIPGTGCSLKNLCLPSTCSQHATCITVSPKEVKCVCLPGYRGDGKSCYGNIMHELRRMNSNPQEKWYNQLSDAITLFESAMSWPLSSLGPFTVFVPTNKGFKGTSVKTLLRDAMGARYLSKLHVVAGELTFETLKMGGIFHSLTGKSCESIVIDGDPVVKIRIHGSRKKGDIVGSDIVATNGVIHIINKLMDSVAPTIKSEKEETLMKIISDNGKFSKFKTLLEKTNMANLIEEAGPYTVFAPTDTAMNAMNPGYMDYLLSDEGKQKLLELLRNHVISSVALEVVNVASSSHSVSLANQVLTFNVTNNGQILVNNEVILEADVEAKNGRLYSVDGVLIPASIEPVLPHRCNRTTWKFLTGRCEECSQVTASSCSSGKLMRTTKCLLRGTNVFSTFGCVALCNKTVTVPICCKGFYGQDCSVCPGGFNTPCSGHGKCMDGLDGNGTCVCEENFKGSRCHYCSRPDRYGLSCDKVCPCMNGQCDNRPESDGSCKVDSCQMGYTGKYCERHTRPCGPRVEFCHANADCDFNGGAVKCVCKPGYQGDGIVCVEMDPCAPPHRGGCGLNAKCVKTGPGTHACQCFAGWKEVGEECQPINSCLQPDRGGCHANATCIYVGPGQSDCVCKGGFHGDGVECHMVNPCVNQNGGCHFMASCRFLPPGEWKCICEEGYEGDGRVCYGTVVQELALIPNATEFYKWVRDAGLAPMLSETKNLTLLVPSTNAAQNMTKEDKDFWMENSNLASIVKYHMLEGVHLLSEIKNKSSPLQLNSFLKKPLLAPSVNKAIIAESIVSGDIAARNGILHVIDSVLVPHHNMSESLLEQLALRAEVSVFRELLIQYNLTQELEQSSAYTVFAPTNSAIAEFLKKSGSSSMDVNTTRYHILPSERLLQKDMLDGLYRETMLGVSFQVAVFVRDNKVYVNNAEVNTTDLLTYKGVLHCLSSVLEIQQNRCDKERFSITTGSCQNCYKQGLCPNGMKQILPMRRNCLYKNFFNIVSLGCKLQCKNKTIDRQCCSGFFGEQCERCPGPVNQPCFGRGTCQDGTNGTGTCQCSKGFAGTACQTCQPGKYGSQCDMDCACVHGRCHDGIQGDGMCECDVGWRGVKCDTAITEDTCTGRCHTSANCLVQADGSSQCKCAAGFEGNGTYCSAMNACKDNNGGCSIYGTCRRTLPGQRDCKCKPGYAGDGVVCVEINPCIDGTSDCHQNAQCVHTGPNRTACICRAGYSGDGKDCQPINVCKKNNGDCHNMATCTMTGPGERNCTCRDGFIGSGLNCKGTVFKELLFNKNWISFYFRMMMEGMYDLKGRGPFTVFVPGADVIKKANLEQWSTRGMMTQVLRHHVVTCRTLLPDDLQTTLNVTTLHGEMLHITFSQNITYINNNIRIVASDTESLNGIIHEIDSILVPNTMQSLRSIPLVRQRTNLTDVARDSGYTTFTKLLVETEVEKLMSDHIHQPITLFLPTDRAMSALPQKQKDFIFSAKNRAHLVEYLKYHVVRDAKVSASDLTSSSLRTLQGSDLQVTCGNVDTPGELFLSGGKCRIVQRHLVFNGGIAHGIDCLLNPPSLGGRCDIADSIAITTNCGSCSRTQACPNGSKFKGTTKCMQVFYQLSRLTGCQSECSMVFWKPKCCKGYFGQACMACPGGAEMPCSGRGTCDEGQLGNGTCTCNPGFGGVACELCVEGHYGSSCQACNCTKHGSCDEGVKGSGACFCDQGWTGPYCETQLAKDPVCTPTCSKNAVCKENNTCECQPFYEGDGLTCTVVAQCKQQNGGCAPEAQCSQKGVKVTCSCTKGYSGDGYVCMAVDPCAAEDTGGCHEHATCRMTGPGKRICECNSGYIGDGISCEVKELPINRCAQDNGQCHSDAICTDLHFEDTKVGVFHIRSPKGQYKLTYSMAQDSCIKEGGTIASYTQLVYAQQAGFHLCIAGWLDQARVAYPTTYANQRCGYGHVGIVDYGIRANQSESWDVYCYRMKDVQCTCKPGYIGDGYTCIGNLMQVLSSTPAFSNFFTQILNYSSNSHLGKEFVRCLTNLTMQSTLFVPDNNGLDENETLSGRDLEYHILEGSTLVFKDLTNGSRLRTRLGHSLTVLGIANFSNPVELSSVRYVDDRFISDWDIPASNGIIHVLQGPLRAPLLHPMLQTGHKAGLGIGVLLVLLLIAVVGFAAYRFYNQKAKPFQFQYFKDDEGDNPTDANRSICNPMYDSDSSGPRPTFLETPDEDKHKVIDSGPYDLFHDS